ncbi:MAG: ImmA/IrrE family metallo-endopeptidase [Bdellovibrionaceae bacterium]|nr:ImmA/IrrE family metallo-endopeptidase [Pseudobdellovibrionaceae bacterium]
MAKTFLPPEEIEAKVQEFLQEYHPDNMLPIPIEEIIDLKMGIHIVPTPDMMAVSGVDAVTSHDLKQINIDHEQFEKKPNRARFTLAHEVGHIVLHKDFIDAQNFKEEAEWRTFVLNDLHRDPMEVQANIFAAYLLMPSDHLEKEFIHAKKELAANPAFKGMQLPPDKTLAPYLAKPLAQKFEVSEEAMTIRLTNWIQRK